MGKKQIALCADCGREIKYTIKEEVITPSSCEVCGMEFKKVLTSPSTGNRVLTN